MHLESNIKDTIQVRIEHNKVVKAFRQVDVRAGIRQRFTVLIPSSLNEVNYAQVYWESTETGKTGNTGCRSNIDYRAVSSVVIERDNSIQDNDFLSKIPEPSYNRYSAQKYQDIEASKIPDYWQGLPHWMCLILTPKGDKKLDAAQRKALQQWVHSGGHLFVTTPELQQSWLKIAPCTLVNNDIRDGIQALYEAVRKNNRQTNSSILQYQVPGTDEVPSGIFISIMILFVVIVGPVNYIWVRRKKQIHLFLLTTPLISLIFCITMATFGILADGLSAYRSSIELTWLDHERKQSCHWNSVSWFSGLSPGDIETSLDTSVQILNNKLYSNYIHDTHPLEAIWESKQVLSGNWIRTRTHQQLQFTKPQTERTPFCHYAKKWTLLL